MNFSRERLQEMKRIDQLFLFLGTRVSKAHSEKLASTDQRPRRDFPVTHSIGLSLQWREKSEGEQGNGKWSGGRK